MPDTLRFECGFVLTYTDGLQALPPSVEREKIKYRIINEIC